MSEPIKMKEAFNQIKKEWPSFPKSATYLAIKNGRIPCRRSSNGKHARIFVKVEDIQTYLRTLNR